MKDYDKNGNEGYILEIDIGCPRKLFNLHRDLPFLHERKKNRKV